MYTKKKKRRELTYTGTWYVHIMGYLGKPYIVRVAFLPLCAQLPFSIVTPCSFWCSDRAGIAFCVDRACDELVLLLLEKARGEVEGDEKYVRACVQEMTAPRPEGVGSSKGVMRGAMTPSMTSLTVSETVSLSNSVSTTTSLFASCSPVAVLHHCK